MIIKLKDKIIEEAINQELERQKNEIELIASENYASIDVMKATGSVLTNKYAEGYPQKRYYGGTQYVDIVETQAIERLKKLFNVNFANVQPHSGTQANAAAIAAFIKPGDKILGLSLASGGHLSHGYKVNFSGKFYHGLAYEVNENGFLDYDEIEKIALEHKPQIIICGFTAYSRYVNFKRFREIADKVGCYLLADIAHIAGMVATGFHPSPVGYADVITSTTHKTLRSARGGIIMWNNDEYTKKINSAVFPGSQGGPLLHSIAGKAVGFYEALQDDFKIYIKNVCENAKAFANRFIELGVKVISGGTDNHLFLIDVKSSYNMTGKEASSLLQSNNITVNKNTIPKETESAFVTSGIRLGTPAMTTRGFTKKEFICLADLIHKILKKKLFLHDEVAQLIKNFPLYE